MPRTRLLAWALPAIVAVVGLSSGCAHRHAAAPAAAQPVVVETVVEIPGQEVYLADAGYQQQGVAEVMGAPAPVDDYAYVEDAGYYDEVQDPDVLGYETLSSGDSVDVIVYVHTYEQPIETYPVVVWSGRRYYNINGTLVYYSPHFGHWCHYWGPPVGLVYAWNHRYPARPYAWGSGYYGAGWYWGGASSHGYHAYAPRDVYPGRHTGRPHPGGPSGRPDAHPGGPSGRPGARPGGAGSQPGRPGGPGDLRADRGKPPVVPSADRGNGRKVGHQAKDDRPGRVGRQPTSQRPSGVGSVQANRGTRPNPPGHQPRSVRGAQPQRVGRAPTGAGSSVGNGRVVANNGRVGRAPTTRPSAGPARYAPSTGRRPTEPQRRAVTSRPSPSRSTPSQPTRTRPSVSNPRPSRVAPTPSRSPSRSAATRSPQRPSVSRTPSRSVSRSPSRAPSRPSVSRTPSRSPSRSVSRAPSRSPSRSVSRSPSRSPSHSVSRSPSRSSASRGRR